MTVRDEKVEQPNWQRHYLAPSCRTAAPGESEALDVLGHLIGGGQTSLLYRDAGDRGEARRRRPGPITMARRSTRAASSSTPRPRRASRLRRSTRRSTRCWRSSWPMGSTQARSSGQRPALSPTRSTPATASRDLARWYGSSLAIGQTISDVEEWPSKIDAVDAKAVLDGRAPLARRQARRHRPSPAAGGRGRLKPARL